MPTDNRLFDDLSRVATGALSALTGLREEIESRVREQVEKVLSRLNLVTREEFEAVREMAMRAREAQEALEARLGALESPAKPRSASRKSGSRKPSPSPPGVP